MQHKLLASSNFPELSCTGKEISSVFHPIIQQCYEPSMGCQQIWRFFHLADSEKQVPIGQLGHDKLYKKSECS